VDMLLQEVVSFLPAVAIGGHCSVAMWSVLLPLLSTLSALSGAFGGRLSGHGPATPAAVLTLPTVKAAPAASLQEACWVAMLSNTLVVFGCSWPSS
jgi:hypothetical protein